MHGLGICRCCQKLRAGGGDQICVFHCVSAPGRVPEYRFDGHNHILFQLGLVTGVEHRLVVAAEDGQAVTDMVAPVAGHALCGVGLDRHLVDVTGAGAGT